MHQPSEISERTYSIQNQSQPRVAASSSRSPMMAAARSRPAMRASSHYAIGVLCIRTSEEFRTEQVESVEQAAIRRLRAG